ncbi:hypothetical protein [Solibacillus silvestris]|nr:hypothetical protein [Solibacillus silvestris]
MSKLNSFPSTVHTPTNKVESIAFSNVNDAAVSPSEISIALTA